MKKYGLIIILFLLASFLVYCFNNNHDYIKTGNLYISEIVASNSYTYKNKDNEYADYIEIYNGNNYDVDLEGYRLTDKLVDANKWVFPQVTIKAQEYLLVYADKKNNCDDECHTNFKLKKSGETLSLIDNTGNIISRVTYPELATDMAYSFVNKKYLVTIPSPLKENQDIKISTDIKKYSLKINEYMTHNKSSVHASNGGYYDFVELYNDGDEDINLKGLALSDDSDTLNKFILPDKVLKAHEYVVIYLTGKEEVENAIYANFKLSDKDTKLLLSLNGKIIDAIDLVILPNNVSYGRKDDEWLYFMSPTPGYENNTHGMKEALTKKDTGDT